MTKMYQEAVALAGDGDPVQPTRDLEAAALEAARLGELASMMSRYSALCVDVIAASYLTKAAAVLTSLSAERNELKASRDRSLEKLIEVAKKLDASEAEASDLRRKLEEMRQAYEAARYVPGDHPIVPAKIVAFMKVCAAALAASPFAQTDGGGE